MPDQKSVITQVAELILNTKNILFITGAGISAESGLPTYRGIGGLYENKMTDEGIPIETALSGYVMRTNPEITWKYLWQIGSACHKAHPNAAHRIISSIQDIKPECWVLTQNVDGLHRAAGTKNLVEIHGHAFDLYCTECGFITEAETLLLVYDDKPELPPTCPQCQGIIRPDVVLFGEMLPASAVEKMNWLSQRDNDLVISIGTSASFPYIIEPVLRAREQEKNTVEINPVSTEISDLYSYHIRLDAADAMKKIWKKIEEKRETNFADS
jgi:NAD-dependent deacetylase